MEGEDAGIAARLERGDLAGALALIEAELAAGRETAELRNMQGVAFALSGQVRAAADALALAARLAPHDPEPVSNLVQLLDGAGLSAQVDARLRAIVGAPPSAGAALEALRARASARLGAAVARLSQGDREGWESGAEEGAALEAAYQAIIATDDLGLARVPAAETILMRLGGHERLGAPVWGGDDQLLTRDLEVAPHLPLARIGPDLQERLDVLAQRRRWAAALEAEAARNPIRRGPRRGGGKLRVGFLSSDLRRSTIGAFAWPLFARADRDRVELCIYSRADGPADPAQAAFQARSELYRAMPAAGVREIAQQIADDGVDALIDLGERRSWPVLAYAPAPVQLSWLGYPNPLGLSSSSGMVLDPYLAPEDPRLLLEPARLMPRTWVVMSEAYFEAEPRPAPAPPSARNGYVTFGSLNQTYKAAPRCLDAWAQVVAATPDSRFLIVRPETGAPSFREHVTRRFAAHGVGTERLRFEAVRGAHLAWYDEIDISLDPFPVTGGTTTCETLWMGVPVVTLVGPAVFERLSWSLLSNVGLGDLAARDVEAYVRIAVELAQDAPRRLALRSGLRDLIRASPLGQEQAFVEDFYALVERAVRA